MTELTVNAVDVSRLAVASDEVVLVTVSDVISSETANRIKDAFAHAFKETGGHVPSILVIDNRLKVNVVKASDVARQPQPNPDPPIDSDGSGRMNRHSNTHVNR